MKILLAIDGSSYSEAAIAEVARRPWPARSEVRVLTVDTPIDAGLFRDATAMAFDQLMERQRALALSRLDAAVEAVKKNASGLEVTPLLREGNAKEVILEEAERWGADLIVLGSSGYGAIRRLFLGSVALAVVSQAPCSVEVVRAPAGSVNATESASA